MKTNPLISEVIAEIVTLCKPDKIILVSNKFSTSGELTSFKLCAVVPDSVKESELESEIYLKTECPIPFGVLVYNRSEWEELIEDDCSFAGKVDRSGTVLYG